MLRIITLILSLTLIFFDSFSQQNKNSELTGDIVKDVNSLLPQGNIIVDIMNGTKQNQRQAELMEKFKSGVQKNYEWFVDYMKEFENVKPLPYHTHLGLTQDEYKEMLEEMKKMEIVSSGTAEVTIVNENNIIRFKSMGSLAVLGAIMIDLQKNIVMIGHNVLNFVGSSDITTEANGLKSKWKGYNWNLEEPKNLEKDQFKDLENLNAKFYKLTIGRLEKNGKTFLQIQGKEFENGKAKVAFDLPLIF